MANRDHAELLAKRRGCNDSNPCWVACVEAALETIDNNLEFYKKEAELAGSILQQNRHRSVEPYEWFGPDPEPRGGAGRLCECQGCFARFAELTTTLDRSSNGNPQS